MSPAESSAAHAHLARRTLLARAIAARDIHDATLPLACPTTTGGGDGGITSARRLGVLHKRYRTLCVLAARICEDATWEQVADWLDVSPAIALALYGQAEDRWRAGDPQPWAPILTDRGAAAVIVGAEPIDIDTPAAADRADADLAAYCAVRACTTPCTHTRACP